jgi:hypothetical protein
VIGSRAAGLIDLLLSRSIADFARLEFADASGADLIVRRCR